MVKTKVKIQTLRFNISMTLVSDDERFSINATMPVMNVTINCDGNKRSRLIFLN